MIRANGLWFIPRILPGAETTYTNISGDLRALSGPADLDGGLTIDVIEDPGTAADPKPYLRALSPIARAELWHHRLGHPDMHQLLHLKTYATGLPAAPMHVHPVRGCQICQDA